MSMKDFPLSKVYRLIEAGPVVMLTTNLKGRNNIMTMSWHMAMEFEPSLIGCIVSPSNYTYKTLVKTKECVIAIPAVDIAVTAVKVGNCSGRDTDKFKKFGLTVLPAEKVAAPLVAECLYNLECRVVDTGGLRKYAMFVLEAVKAWVKPSRKERRLFHANGDGTFAVDGRTLNLRRQMVKFKDMID